MEHWCSPALPFDAGCRRPESIVPVQIKGTRLIEGSPRSFFQLLHLCHRLGEGMARKGGGSEELHCVRRCFDREMARKTLEVLLLAGPGKKEGDGILCTSTPSRESPSQLCICRMPSGPSSLPPASGSWQPCNRETGRFLDGQIGRPELDAVAELQDKLVGATLGTEGGAFPRSQHRALGVASGEHLTWQSAPNRRLGAIDKRVTLTINLLRLSV